MSSNADHFNHKNSIDYIDDNHSPNNEDHDTTNGHNYTNSDDIKQQNYNNESTNGVIEYSVANHHNDVIKKEEVIDEEVNELSDGCVDTDSSAGGGVGNGVESAGDLWWNQNQTPVATTGYELSGNGVITSVMSKSGRLNGSENNLIDYDWYGSHPNNVIHLSSTPTTISTNNSNNNNIISAQSTDHYISYGQNHNTFQSSPTQQLVIRPQTTVTNHRRTNSGSEAGIPDLFSPTEGRECVNCGKHLIACNK